MKDYQILVNAELYIVNPFDDLASAIQ
jgi:hypothetical protein